MVIGFDGSRAFLKERTGTENYSYQLLKALAKLDKKNNYIIYTSSIINDAAASLMIFPKKFKIVEIGWPRLWTQGGLALQTFQDDLDVLFVPAHTLPVIRKPELKTVITVHDLGSEYLPSMHQFKQRLYLSIMQKYQLNSATKIIAVSEATKTDLIKKVGIDPKKIAVVYEGYDKKLFRPIKRDRVVNSLKQYGLKYGKYFLFVGTVQPRKNLERIIRAFATHLRGEAKRSSGLHFGGGTTNLAIAGSRGWLSDDIYKLPKKLGIVNGVKFLGYVPEKNLPALYSGAIALTFPSLFEGFGLPILEAQACGCPVITSNISSMSEVAGPPVFDPEGLRPEWAGGGAILVDPYDAEDIARAMIRVKREGERVKMIKAGFENVKRFSWEKCATQTLKLLETV